MIAVLLASLFVSPAQSRKPAPLFAGDSDVEITLALPLKTLIRERMERVEVEGIVTLTGSDAAPVRLDVRVSPRGHHRLANCSFPPLRLDFKRAQVEGTLFAEQNRLKLVTPCRLNSANEDYLELEYLVYRMYEQLSDAAFRVRRAHVRYVDTERKGAVSEAAAFFIEPLEGVALRLGLERVAAPRIPLDALDRSRLSALALFQFVIGHTDWSATAAEPGEDCCHNAAVLAPPEQGGFVLVPYDFDQAGIVDADYAVPNEIFTITSVRQRLYRGFCRTNVHLDETIRVFNDERPELEALLDSARLAQATRNKALRYLEASFEIINDAARREWEIVGRCRPG
jgi:hypothetical protein